MSIPKIETAFTILKEIRKQVKDWESESLNDIKSSEVYDVITLLRLFLEIKGGD